jgi:hypothetical protein
MHFFLQLANDMPGPTSVCGYTVLLLDLCRFFSFLILHTVGRTPCTGDQPVARPPPTHRTTETHNKIRDIHPLSGTRTHNPAFKREETVHALDRAATMIGPCPIYPFKLVL